jgi:hypothetical protein
MYSTSPLCPDIAGLLLGYRSISVRPLDVLEEVRLHWDTEILDRDAG